MKKAMNKIRRANRLLKEAIRELEAEVAVLDGNLEDGQRLKAMGLEAVDHAFAVGNKAAEMTGKAKYEAWLRGEMAAAEF